MPPISDVREISNLAYGFIGSKVLFSALNARIFELLAQGARPLADLERETGIAGNRLDNLLTACTTLGLNSEPRSRSGPRGEGWRIP
jgi:hypothetical protein